MDQPAAALAVAWSNQRIELRLFIAQAHLAILLVFTEDFVELRLMIFNLKYPTDWKSDFIQQKLVPKITR